MLVLAGVAVVGRFSALAQIDSDPRQLLQLGYNQPLEGRGPISGYAFYYLNKPQFLRTNLTLRLAVAPVYLDSELGISEALGPNTDLGIGVAGGGFADSYSEVRGGKYIKEESFRGHGSEVSLNVYHRFNPASRIPLYAVLHNHLHWSIYERESSTSPAFALPEDRTTFNTRAGLRWGGQEPVILPDLAMELSAWYEGRFRTCADTYGFAGDRQVESSGHFFWGRALLVYTFPEWKHTFSLNLTTGASLNADRFSAYRLGAILPLSSEFPLNLPGYYFQEISARQFALLSGYYSLPLDSQRRWSLTAMANTAAVDYLPSQRQAGDWLSGIGGGLSYRSPSGEWHVLAGYAYGIDALRTHGRGANSIGILCQVDLGVRQRAKAKVPTPDIPNKSRGLFRLFQ